MPTRIYEAWLTFGFTKREAEVFAAVCRKTYGWRKKIDRISYSQIAEITKLHPKNVARVMRNLRSACVLRCEGTRRAGEALYWGVQEEPRYWHLPTLKRLRNVEGRTSSNERITEATAVGDALTGPGVKMTPPPGVKTAPTTGSRFDSPQQIGREISTQKTGAADAAVSFSQSREIKEEGLLESQEVFLSDGKSDREAGCTTPTQEQKHRIAYLCAELEKGDLNPYPWLARTNKQRTPIVIVIEVLEQAVSQKDSIRDFWPWAEKVRDAVAGTLAIEEAERTQEGLKRGNMLSAGQVLRRVVLRGADANVRGGLCDSGPASEGEVSK